MRGLKCRLDIRRATLFSLAVLVAASTTAVGAGRRDGAICVAAAECATAACTGGRCGTGARPDSAPAKADGAFCVTSRECQAGTCYQGFCGSPKKPRGTACVTAQDCGSMACSAGQCQ